MLETDWIKVGTAGKTIDGREITPEMLERAGALYDQALYTATINSEHFFFPGLGYVSAVKAEADEQGRLALWCKLLPSAEFIARNHAKRQLFFSMELTPDFPAERDWYLSGLAITDIPASQGLAPQLFNASERKGERFYNTGSLERSGEGRWQPTERIEAAPAEPAEEPPWVKRFLASISAALRGGAISTEREEAMKPEERKEFDELKAGVAKLTTAVEKLTADPPASDEPPPTGEQPPAAQEGAAPGDADLLTAAVKAALAEQLKPLQDKVAAVEAFMAETRATEPLTVDEPSGGGDQQIWF